MILIGVTNNSESIKWMVNSILPISPVCGFTSFGHGCSGSFSWYGCDPSPWSNLPIGVFSRNFFWKSSMRGLITRFLLFESLGGFGGWFDDDSLEWDRVIPDNWLEWINAKTSGNVPGKIVYYLGWIELQTNFVLLFETSLIVFW